MDKVKIRKELIKYTENLKEIRKLKLSTGKSEEQRTKDIQIIKSKIEELKKMLEE